MQGEQSLGLDSWKSNSLEQIDTGHWLLIWWAPITSRSLHLQGELLLTCLVNLTARGRTAVCTRISYAESQIHGHGFEFMVGCRPAIT